MCKLMRRWVIYGHTQSSVVFLFRTFTSLLFLHSLGLLKGIPHVKSTIGSKSVPLRSVFTGNCIKLWLGSAPSTPWSMWESS